MLEYRPKASKELSEGYAQTASLAQQRRERVEAWGDEVEAKAWGKVESYCRMMATCQFTDEPETLVNYVPLDDRIIDRRTLDEIMNDAETGEVRPWTTLHQMAYAAAMALLSPMERAVAEMYYGAQMKREDIAQALHYSHNTVDGLIKRARKKWAKLKAELV